MSSAFKNLLLLVSAALALMGGFWLAHQIRSQPEAANTAAYGGGEMINFTLPDLDDRQRSLNEWRGKVIVLNFWGTWCPPCREEIPLLVDIQKRLGVKGLQVIGVAIDDKAAVLRYRKASGINYPLLMGGETGLDLIAQYGNRLGSLPFSVVIDRKGAIVARKLGAYVGNELEHLIIPLLSASSSNSV